jgi:hypothetical protein
MHNHIRQFTGGPVLGKFLLWLTAAMFIGYGLVCLFLPGLPAGYAGLAIVSGDALPELAGMYGGLQTGMGVFSLMGALKAEYYRPALMMLLLGVGGLALARCLWAFSGADEVSGYTFGAMATEYGIAILAALALRRR